MLRSLITNYIYKSVYHENLKAIKIVKIEKSEIEYLEIVHNPETGREIKNKKIYKLNDDDKFILNLEIAQFLK